MDWNKTSDMNPPRGKPVVVLTHTNKDDSKTLVSDIAYYCDGSYYALKLDPRLDILRKVCIPKPEYWVDYRYFNESD